MTLTDDIKKVVEKNLNTKVNKIYLIGNGATASCYCVEITDLPYKLVIKHSLHRQLLLEEKEMNNFLREKVSFTIPETYFFSEENNNYFLGMELINGVNGRNIKLRKVRDKKHLAHNIIDCFLDMQGVHNDKFGPFNNPKYDSWKEYYSEFFVKIYDFTVKKYNCGEVNKTIMNAVELIKQNFDVIFFDVDNTPCLSHGDFWTPNMIIDPKKSEITGVLDPFNTRFTEPEYELFCLTLGLGKKLKLYKRYKERVKTSRYCDLKIELYALCNEIDWWMRLDNIDSLDYINMRAKRLIKQVKKTKLEG